MSNFTFIFNGIEILIPYKQKEKLSSIFQRFCIKIGVQRENLNFLCNGKILDDQITEDKIPINQNGKRFIYVDNNNYNSDFKSQDVIINSNVIICPECQESASISVDNYHLIISKCKNGHKIENIKIKDFEDTQKINISKIICDQCKIKNMGNCQDNLFFRCCECKQNLCLLCKTCHNPSHNIFNYFNKYYTCEEHGETFISYCYDCESNLCFICEENHNTHKIKSFKNLFYEDKDKLKEELDKFKKNIDIMKEKINNFKQICDKVIESYNILYSIKKVIYDNINLKKRNIHNLNNQKIFINQINEDIEQIIKEINITFNFSHLLNIYEQIEYNKQIHKNYIIIKYKINKDRNKIKIFDKDFVAYNKNHCKIIYDNQDHELQNSIKIKSVYKSKDILEIKLIGIENITSAYCMFYNCSSLISLPDISEWNTINVNDMSCMFSGCTSLSSLPDISKWNTSNVTNMNCMFSNCTSLISLPDISKWDTSNLTNIGFIFSRCSSLVSLPDISKWNTSKINNIAGIFSGCTSLISLPDISKWDTSNVTNKSMMFNECSPSLIIPDKFKE